MARSRIGLFKLTSCSGCLLEFLNMLSMNRDLASKLEIVSPMFSDSVDIRGLDASIIEGSISSVEQEELVKRIRESSKLLIIIGSCSVFGGLQNLSLSRNKSVREVVDVDVEIPGCPVECSILYRVLSKALIGARDVEIYESLCMECKRLGVECLLISRNTLCLGPLIRSGCGALCPSTGRGCIGCYGFREDVRREHVDLFRENIVKRGLDPSALDVFVKAHSLSSRDG